MIYCSITVEMTLLQDYQLPCNWNTSEADEEGCELSLHPVSNLTKAESDVITLPAVAEDRRV